MEVRRVLLLSVMLSNLPTLKCSVLFNSAWTPPGDTQFAHLGILNFQDCRILVPRLRLTSYLNTSETTESIRICILLSCSSLPANDIFGVALFPSSVKHLRIVFPVLVNWRSKRCCLYYANASVPFRSHRFPNVAFCLLNACSFKNKTSCVICWLCTRLQSWYFPFYWNLAHSCWLTITPLSSGRPRRGWYRTLLKTVLTYVNKRVISFKFSEYLIDASSFQFRLVIVYRIPYSAVHPITSSMFFLKFSDYQDPLLLSKVPLCISQVISISIWMSLVMWILLNLLTC